MTRFARFAWSLLAYDVTVAAWGTYVRATGSGAGCGRHWPLCNGEVVPRAPRVETLVELSHRLTSGIALIATLCLFAFSLRAYPARHRVRRAATAAAAFMLAEAAIGAGLVLFALVAHDASVVRAVSVSLHLVNTFFLLGSMALTAWWASGGTPVVLRGQGSVAWATAVPLAATLLVAATGAVTALGDTLFPSTSLTSGLAQDFAPGAHLLTRARGLHPLLAAATAVAVVASGAITRLRRPAREVAQWTRLATALCVLQVGVGLLDLAALAPVALQLVHLVLADMLWIALVLSACAALGAPIRPGRPIAPARRDLPEESGGQGDAV